MVKSLEISDLLGALKWTKKVVTETKVVRLDADADERFRIMAAHSRRHAQIHDMSWHERKAEDRDGE